MVTTEWEDRQKLVEEDVARIDEQINALELEAGQTIRKIKYLESQTAIKYMEEDLLKFGVFFERIPTYEEIKTRTENKALITGITEL